MSACKTYTIIVDEQTGDRIEFEYSRSDRVWNIYAIDGQTGYPIHSSYAGNKAERDIIIRNEAPAWFEDEDERNAARAAYEMFGKANEIDAPDTRTAYEYTFTTTRTPSGYTCIVRDRDDEEGGIYPPICNWTAPTKAEAIEGAAALIDASFVCDESDTAGDAAYNIRELALDKLEAAGIKSTPEAAYRLTTWAENYVSSSPRDHWTDDRAAELAAVEAAAPEALASEGNPEDAVNLVAYTAFAALHDGATPDTYDDSDMEQLERLMGYASEIVRRDGPAHGIKWAPYQRYELEAFLGEPKDYDVSAIEAEATAYDYSTGQLYWIAFGEDLAAIAERHELYSYTPAI